MEGFCTSLRLRGASIISLCLFCIGMLMTHKVLSKVSRSINNQEASYSTRSFIIAGPLPERVNVNETNIIPNYHNLFMDHIEGALYFAEKKRIRKIVLSSGIVSTVAGNGEEGPSLTTDPHTTQLLWSNTFQRWKDKLIWVDSLYRVLQLDFKSNTISKLFGSGINGNTNETVTNPLKVESGIMYSITVDSSTGDIYIGDFNNYCVRKLDGSTGLASIYAGICGVSGISSNVSLSAAKFGKIQNVKYCNGTLFIFNSPRIQKIYNNNGEMWVKTIAEKDVYGIDCYNGDLYGYTASYIFKIIENLNPLDIIGTGSYGNTPDGKINLPSSVGYVSGMTIDKSNGDIYFIEKSYNIRKIRSGYVSTITQYKNLNGVNAKNLALDIHGASLAYDDSGLYIAEQSSIKFLNFSTFKIEEVSGIYYDCTNPYMESCFTVDGSIHSAKNGIYVAYFGIIKFLSKTGQITNIVTDNGSGKLCSTGDVAKNCILARITCMQYYKDELYFITDNLNTFLVNFGKVTKNGTIELLTTFKTSFFYIRQTDNTAYYMSAGSLFSYDMTSKNVTLLYVDKSVYYTNLHHVTEDGRAYYSTWDNYNFIIKVYKLNETTSTFISGAPLGNDEDGGLASNIRVAGLISLHYSTTLDSILIPQGTQVRRISSIINQCFGISGLEKTVCSGNGACTNSNTCECISGFFGVQCNISSCYGIRQDNPTVCNGKGKCNSDGKCACQYGYGGVQCESKSCFGIVSTDPSVCNGRGNCSDMDLCKCFSDSRVRITGDACENLLCKGVDNGLEDFFLSSDTRVCSKHGKCSFNSTSSKIGCSCDNGYYGDRCDLYNCFSISKNSANACSGHGKCSDIDTCQCYNNDTIGHYYGSSCTACHPAYTGVTCTEKACSASTCLNGGSCGGGNQCICSGNFTGLICDKCTADHFGANCNLYCNDKISCSGQGVCNLNGQCTCYNDREHGFWTGSSCNSCFNGYYGSDCVTYFTSFNSTGINLGVIYGQISKYFDGISFKLMGPSYYTLNTIPCSTLIHSSDLVFFGSEPKCFWTDRIAGNFKIEFDNDFPFGISLLSSIRLNTNVFSKSPSNFIRITLTLSEEVKIPTANIKLSKTLYSNSENIYISGANSFSGDKKGLEYYWDISGNNIPTILLQSIILNREPLIKFEKGQLRSGIYTIFLSVKSQASRLLSTTESILFQVQDAELPSVTIVGNKEVIVKSNEKSVLFKKLTNIPDSLKNQEMVIDWKLIEGPSINFKKDIYNNLVIEQFISGKWKYSFKVSVYPIENPGLSSSDFLIINTEQPMLSLSLTLIQSTTLSQVIQVNYHDPENNSDEKENWRWTCIDSETRGYCGDIVINKISQYAKNLSTLISIDRKDFTNELNKNPTFTLTILKGQRSVSSSIKLNLSHPPPVIGLLDVSPKIETINDNDKISIEILHPDQDPLDRTLTVKTQWKVDSILVSESETLSVSDEIQTVISTISSPFSSLKVVNKNQQSAIILNSKELEDGMKHSIKVKVSFMNKNDEIVATEIYNNFTKSTPPKKCPCKISPSTGVSMKTDFTFTCENCQNEENSIEIKQGYIDKDTGIKVPVPLSQDSTMKIPSISSLQSSRNFKESNGNVTLFIELIDTKTGESRMMQSSVSVTPGSASSMTDILDHVSDQTNKISSFVKDGDTIQSVSQTINTVISTSQLLQTLPSSARNSTTISSIQSNLLDTLSTSLQTASSKDSISESSSMAVLAVHSMIKSEDVIEKPVITKSITTLNHVIQLTLKSKVDIFYLSSKPFLNTIADLGNQVSKLRELKEKYSNYESMASLVEDFAYSFVQVQSVSSDPAAIQENVVNAKVDKVFLADYSSSLITSPPVTTRGITYQSYIKIPILDKISEINQYSELTYSMVLKNHVPAHYQQILDSENTTLKVVSPVSVSFSLTSPEISGLSHNVSIYIGINDPVTNGNVYSCFSIIDSDFKLDSNICRVSGRDITTNSIACTCIFDSWKVKNLLIVRDLSKTSSHPIPETSIIFSNDVSTIIIAVSVSVVVLVLLISIVLIIIVFCYFKNRKSKQINPHPNRETHSSGEKELISQDIEQPSKSETSVVSIHM